MSEYMTDITNRLNGNTAVSRGSGATPKVSTDDPSALDMTDFLTLMVAQFQNQSLDNQADTSDMLNQIVQMSMVQAITNITDATVTMYASSLVGKEVTVGQYDDQGNLEEIVGLVTGTGMSGGEQVIFVNGETYRLSEIMAVGKLPEIEMEPEPEGDESQDETDPAEASD